MKREQLKAMGLSDEQIDSIMTLHGQGIEQLKIDLGTKTTELERITTQLGEATTQIEAFQAMGDIEAIKQSAADYQTKLADANTAHATELKTLTYNTKLENALRSLKVKDPAEILPHLKKDTIVLGEDGKFVGLEEQIKPLAESKSYLFDTGKVIPTVVLGGGNDTVLTDAFVDSARKAAGLPDA